jgi:hypothetical protein
MNGFAILFLVLAAVGLLTLPRQWATVPLLMGACYMTNAQSINIGPFHFTVLRLLVAIGVVRTLLRSERLPGGLKGLDWILLVWGGWMLCSSALHKPMGEALVFRLGLVYNALGLYFLIRIFCQNPEDLIQLLKVTALVIVPVAIEMVNEKLTHRNAFGFLGGVSLDVMFREGKWRAQGPFGHPILAGTVGGLCVPLMLGLWAHHPRVAKVGLAACLTMVVSSASSGPLMTSTFAFLAVGMWRWRHLIPSVRIAAVVVYLLCNMIMTRPAYYLLEKIDLTGSSTGYHRAALIESSINHMSEWLLAGTDYTRHWMPTGVSWSEDHSDITNHYLYYAVTGGLPAMVIFIAAVWMTFRYVGESLRMRQQAPFNEQFLIWSVGASQFAHTATMISVAYFDQSVMFLYLNLAVVGSIHATALASASTAVLQAESAFLTQQNASDRKQTLIQGPTHC